MMISNLVQHNYNDLTNQTFGKWTVLRKLGQIGPTKDVLWECRCQCGLTKPVKRFFLTKGYSKQCKRCAKLPRQYKEELSECVWNAVVRNAIRREIQLEILRTEALEIFIAQDRRCALSGVEIQLPKTGTDFIQGVWTASLDRINSQLGYVVGNVQWVHKDINMMKGSLTQDRFISLCKLVATIYKTR